MWMQWGMFCFKSTVSNKCFGVLNSVSELSFWIRSGSFCLEAWMSADTAASFLALLFSARLPWEMSVCDGALLRPRGLAWWRNPKERCCVWRKELVNLLLVGRLESRNGLNARQASLFLWAERLSPLTVSEPHSLYSLSHTWSVFLLALPQLQLCGGGAVPVQLAAGAPACRAGFTSVNANHFEQVQLNVPIENLDDAFSLRISGQKDCDLKKPLSHL